MLELGYLLRRGCAELILWCWSEAEAAVEVGAAQRREELAKLDSENSVRSRAGECQNG